MTAQKFFSPLGMRSSRRRTFCPESLEGRNLLSTLVAAPPADVHTGTHYVPMKGDGEGVVTPGQLAFDNLKQPYVPVTYTGTGHLAHFGQVTIRGSHDSYPEIVGFNLNGTPQISGDVITSGKLTITAANGDRLDMTYTGSGVLISTPAQAEAGLFLYQDQFAYTITGGTGRFAGAKGTGFINATDEAPNPAGAAQVPFTFDLSGTISTVGSNHKNSDG